MAVLWADNFSNYGSATDYPMENMTDGLYADAFVALVADPDGVSSGKVLYAGGVGGAARRVFGGDFATIGLAARYWVATLPNENNTRCIGELRDNTNTAQLSLIIQSTGTLTVNRGVGSDSGTALYTTSTPVIVAGAWNHIEIKATIHKSTGAVEVRVNEVVVINLTNVDTQATGLASVAQWEGKGTSVSNGHYYMKDLICWDTTGSENNDFIGDTRVITLIPDTDVSLNWACSTGSDGSNLIDESDPSAADYIAADPSPPAAFVCELTDLPADVTVVKALLPVVRAFKTDGGTATIQVSLVSSGVDDAGSSKSLTVDDTGYFDVSELDPNTGTDWTPATTNAARLKINRTA